MSKKDFFQFDAKKVKPGEEFRFQDGDVLTVRLINDGGQCDVFVMANGLSFIVSAVCMYVDLYYRTVFFSLGEEARMYLSFQFHHVSGAKVTEQIIEWFADHNMLGGA